MTAIVHGVRPARVQNQDAVYERETYGLVVLAHLAHVWDYYLLDGATFSCNEYGTATASYTEQPNKIPAALNTWSRSLLLSDALVFAYIYKGQCVSGARGSSFSSRASPGRRWPFGQGSSIKRTGEGAGVRPASVITFAPGRRHPSARHRRSEQRRIFS